jgi:hypothetical protein
MKIGYDCSRVASPGHRTLLTPGNICGTHSYKGLNRLQDYNVAGRIVLMERSSDPIGKQTRYLRPAQYLNQLHHCVPPEFCFKAPPLS